MEEDFAANPIPGWRIAGDSSLFAWNPELQTLRVTWDSSKQNSYFFRNLATILTRQDSFQFSARLKLSTITPGTTPGNPYSFQLAFGMFNTLQGLGSNFVRGSGTQSPNLVEFNYFADSGFGATVSSALISSNNEFAASFNFPLEMQTNAWFQIRLAYDAATEELHTTMTREGQSFGPIKTVRLRDHPQFSDFRVNAFSITSYHDGGQTPGSGGSVYAQGMIDDILVIVPPGPVENVKIKWKNPPAAEVQFLGKANWRYTLFGTADFRSWTNVARVDQPTNGLIVIEDAPAGKERFYRVGGERP